MKKIITAITAVALLTLGAVAFAHGPGGWGGNRMGPGYGGHVMRGWGGSGYVADQRFFKETVDLRRDLHNKKFEYYEAARNPGTTGETLQRLEKEIYDIQEKIREKAPRTAYGGFGPGSCW